MDQDKLTLIAEIKRKKQTNKWCKRNPSLPPTSRPMPRQFLISGCHHNSKTQHHIGCCEENYLSSSQSQYIRELLYQMWIIYLKLLHIRINIELLRPQQEISKKNSCNIYTWCIVYLQNYAITYNSWTLITIFIHQSQSTLHSMQVIKWSLSWPSSWHTVMKITHRAFGVIQQ